MTLTSGTATGGTAVPGRRGRATATRLREFRRRRSRRSRRDGRLRPGLRRQRLGHAGLPQPGGGYPDQHEAAQAYRRGRPARRPPGRSTAAAAATRRTASTQPASELAARRSPGARRPDAPGASAGPHRAVRRLAARAGRAGPGGPAGRRAAAVRGPPGGRAASRSRAAGGGTGPGGRPWAWCWRIIGAFIVLGAVAVAVAYEQDPGPHRRHGRHRLRAVRGLLQQRHPDRPVRHHRPAGCCPTTRSRSQHHQRGAGRRGPQLLDRGRHLADRHRPRRLRRHHRSGGRCRAARPSPSSSSGTTTRASAPSRPLSRKIKEIFVAMKLAKEKSKQWILQNYLNTIYLGRGRLRRPGRGARRTSACRWASSPWPRTR